MTNHHVLNSSNVCRKGLCIFNYETGEDGRMLPTKSFQFNPDQLFITLPGPLPFTMSRAGHSVRTGICASAAVPVFLVSVEN
jgi:hypothetical protein